MLPARLYIDIPFMQTYPSVSYWFRIFNALPETAARLRNKVARRVAMKKEENDKREEPMIKAIKPTWCSLSPISWPPVSNDRRNQEIHKTFAGDGELTDHITATYWG